VEEGLGALREELTRRGLRPTVYQRSLLVPIGSDATYDTVRDSVADLGLPLSRMEQRRHRVEELFRDADTTDADSTGADGTGADTTTEAADAR
jgi:ABC-2 type transport system ATP-binding protein